MMELRTLIPAYGADVETRMRCQDDGHPAGCFNPWMGTFCHCGRVIYEGFREPVRWRPPTLNEVAWERMDAERQALSRPEQLVMFDATHVEAEDGQYLRIRLDGEKTYLTESSDGC